METQFSSQGVGLNCFAPPKVLDSLDQRPLASCLHSTQKRAIDSDGGVACCAARTPHIARCFAPL
eukprot:5145690-Amphidinium_carterae.1